MALCKRLLYHSRLLPRITSTLVVDVGNPRGIQGREASSLLVVVVSHIDITLMSTSTGTRVFPLVPDRDLLPAGTKSDPIAEVVEGNIMHIIRLASYLELKTAIGGNHLAYLLLLTCY